MHLPTLSLALLIQHATSHATFQQLWVGNTDMQSTCVRLPTSNSPITDVSGASIRCNAFTSTAGKCTVAAGEQVAVEMHQQQGDRSCKSEAIGGAHYGPVLVYMSKVADAATADGSTGWFKVFEDTWSKASGSSGGDSDNWGTKDLNACCGKMSVVIPKDIPAGDYLLRAEVIALHAAGPSGGAQFYVSCYQLTVTGGGSATPATVLFPGAYKAADPGIGVNIHGALATYVAPGPAVYAGGSMKIAGAGCAGGEVGSSTGAPVALPTKAPTTVSTGMVTSTVASTPSTAPGSGAVAQKYAQCGGQGWTGATTCAAGSTCKASGAYYSQCV